MSKFLLFVSGIILFLLFSGWGMFFPADKHLGSSEESISAESVSIGDSKIGTSLNFASTTPRSVPSKNIATAPLPVKTAPKVATPLVHYTEGQKAPHTLLSAGVITWTNTYREQNNLKTLTRNLKLDAAALTKVHDMFDRQYFEHMSPSGKNSADLVTGVGYEYLWVGENLALGIFSDEKDLVDAWMASPGHRANILNSHFEEIGVGVDEGMYEGRHVWIAVQEFGKPASSCVIPEVSLKIEIEQNRQKIDEFSSQVNVLAEEINALKNQNNADTYNQKVSEYNTLIAAFNPLSEHTQSLIGIYNKEINEYNACIGT